ncbi:MAG: UDP-2,3-diacylglucosamine diphosphatase [Candidatus Neomarinimicrobiota bacterium]|nr:UDP-2,3-diacylglucosamine diphosphatase [Candidatus Neomarinimicrobiota bacterium]
MKLPLYFISDVHLSLKGSSDETEKRRHLEKFISHISETGGTLFIVGDLFDFWFEYKHVIPKAYFDILTVLNEAKLKGLALHFLPGNHDYWMREFLDETLFDEIHPDGLTVEVSDKRFMISHGDGLLSWDRGYRVLRRVLRNRAFVFLYRWIHPDLGYSIAKHFSRHGNYDHHTPDYKKAVVADLTKYCEEQLKNGIDYIIMGHYHQHKKIQLKNGQFLILGDWIKYHSYGYFDGEELSLNSWGTDQTDD